MLCILPMPDKSTDRHFPRSGRRAMLGCQGSAAYQCSRVPARLSGMCAAVGLALTLAALWPLVCGVAALRLSCGMSAACAQMAVWPNIAPMVGCHRGRAAAVLGEVLVAFDGHSIPPI